MRTRSVTGTALAIWVAFVLLGLAWAGGNPPAASPDENAHFVKAYATADGQIQGQGFDVDLTGLDPVRASWFRVSGRSYQMPARLVPPSSVRCYAFDRERTADCQDFSIESGNPDQIVSAATHLGTYSPFPYVATGLVIRTADDFRTGAWRGRLVSLAVCAVLIGWAAVILRERGTLALVGLILAITPMVIFLSASLNTSGMEISAAICVWSALIGLTRKPSAGRIGIWVALTVGGIILALTRPLGAILLTVVVGTFLVFIETPALVGTIRRMRWRERSMAAVVAVACGVSFLWAQLAIPHPHVDLGLAVKSLAGATRDLPNQAREVIGIFGWNETTMPMAAYLLGLALLGAFGLLALRLGNARERAALIGLGLATVAIDLALAVLVESQIGFGMQARYLMPLIVGLPLLSGEIIQTHRSRIAEKVARRFVAAAFWGAAVLHLMAFVSNQHRYAVGASGSWLYPWPSRWSPDGGLAIWLVLATLGSLVLTIPAILAARVSRAPLSSTPE